jgi:hypothetical protein
LGIGIIIFVSGICQPLDEEKSGQHSEIKLALLDVDSSKKYYLIDNS